MESSVKERIKCFIKYRKISTSVFCRSIGVSSAFVSSMRKSIQPDKVERISLNYPELNITWLMTGEGDMLVSENSINIAKEPSPSYNTSKSIPYWNLPVSAGLSVNEVVGKSTPDGYIKGLPGAELAEHILPVVGVSMVPEVNPGAIIGVRKISNWETLNTERIYLIITQDDRMIKRIEHDPDNESVLWCLSPNYAKFKIYKEEIVEIQRVCFVYNPK